MIIECKGSNKKWDMQIFGMKNGIFVKKDQNDTINPPLHRERGKEHADLEASTCSCLFIENICQCFID